MNTGLFARLIAAIRSIPSIGNYLKHREAIASARFNADITTSAPIETTSWQENTLYIDNSVVENTRNEYAAPFDSTTNQDNL